MNILIRFISFTIVMLTIVEELATLTTVKIPSTSFFRCFSQVFYPLKLLVFHLFQEVDERITIFTIYYYYYIY
jgi:hypothetical protein